MAELPELRGAAPEEQAYGPVDHQTRPAPVARHRREVVGPRREPGREAGEPHSQHHGDGLLAPEVHEHAERLVTELAEPPVSQRRRDVAARELALAQSVL